MLKKVAVVGRKKKLIERLLGRRGLVADKKNPEIVIALGGDGIFLYSEQRYPGIAKVFIKHNRECSSCFNHDFSYILDCIAQGNYKIKKEMKILGEIRGKKLVALNEINIHYKPPRALRFSVEVNGKLLKNEVIGDGLIVATPYGSSGYYKSITRKTFSKGIGLAFNNPTIPMKNPLLHEDSVIKVKILREHGILAADCNKELISLKPGDVITIKKNPQQAKVAIIKGRKEKILRY
jgi:NAD+ kinase